MRHITSSTRMDEYHLFSTGQLFPKNFSNCLWILQYIILRTARHWVSTQSTKYLITPASRKGARANYSRHVFQVKVFWIISLFFYLFCFWGTYSCTTETTLFWVECCLYYSLLDKIHASCHVSCYDIIY